MNSVYLDKKFINQISNRLDNFSWKSQKLASCRCPICGDSKKNKKKSRFYFYELSGKMVIKCHNCGLSTTFSSFLKSTFPTEYGNYLVEKIRGSSEKDTEPEKESLYVSPETTDILDMCDRIDKLPSSHFARKYCEARKIPNDKLSLLYYCENFDELVDKIDPEKKINSEQRLVIPFFNPNGTLRAIQGRSFTKNSSLRYITVRVDKSKLAIYGLERVNRSKTVYILEGPLDSLFVDNAIALAGASKVIDSDAFPDSVYVFDNEPRNAVICKLMLSVINKNKKIVIFPKEIKQKDVNDMVMSGIQPYRLNTILRENTYSGLAALAKFNEWCK